MTDDTPPVRSLDAPSTAAQLPAPVTVPDPDSETRKWISFVLLMLLGLMLAASFWGLYVVSTQTGAEAIVHFRFLTTLLNIVFGPLIALVSTVLGFYFGARAARDTG